MQYRFYKGAEKKGRWKAVETSQQKTVFEDKEAYFITVLSVNEKPGKGESVSEDALYQGPFYLDFDSSSISKSIRACKKVIHNLTTAGLREDQFRIWATGKKGFHIEIPMSVFTADAPTHKLPRIYANMAYKLKLPPEADTSVYSKGRGRMWRIPARERSNGKYKVPITLAELNRMATGDYEDICSEPRDEQPAPADLEVSDFLAALYEAAEAKASQEKALSSSFIDPEVFAKLKGHRPPCMEDMLHWRNIKQGVGFNDVSLQFAKAVATFVPGRKAQEELVKEFCQNAKGEGYDTYEKRLAHTMPNVTRAKKDPAYRWNCTTALSVIEDDPCAKCPVRFLRFPEEELESEVEEELAESRQKVVSEDVAEGEDTIKADNVQPASGDGPSPDTQDDEGLLATNKGYAFVGANGALRRVSNFTLRITQIYLEWVETLGEERRAGVMAEVLIGGQPAGKVILDEGCWNSKSSFIGYFHGISNTAFYGKDDDVQRMKSVLMSNIDNNSERIRKVTSSGIHKLKIDDEYIFTYVEPGWSIDQNGVSDKYRLAARIDVKTELQHVEKMKVADKQTTEDFRNLLHSNSPEAVASIVGWFMAAYLRQHISAFSNQFPLLVIHGTAGSGKSSIAKMAARLHGIDYDDEGVAPLSLSTATAFPLWMRIASSTTFPMIMEEYNKHKLKSKYEKFGEIFKDCWNSLTIERGTLDKSKGRGDPRIGATISSFPLSAPVTIISEQNITMPALVQRSVQVGLVPSNISSDQRKTAFENLELRRLEGSPAFLQFSKAAYIEAIQTPIKQVKEWMDSHKKSIPIQIGNRPHFSYTAVLTGLDFLGQIFDRYEIPLKKDVEELKSALIEDLKGNSVSMVSSKQKSEVDLIMEQLAAMAAITSAGDSYPWLSHNVHYLSVPEKDALYMDGLTSHAQYVSFSGRQNHESPVIGSYAVFRELISAEDYCESVSYKLDGFANNRACIKISLSKMKAKGIDISPFTNGG